jgi:flavin-dependent dehydrogenase
MHDLIVVGAGPAGSSAAITAARHGASVLLLDKSRFPRHKVCGEFVSAESLGLLSTLLAPEYARFLDDARRIPQSRIFLDGRMLRADITPPAASVARFDLDFALWKSAETCGVEALAETAAQAISYHGHFHVRTGRGSFESSAVIDASGRWSNLTVRDANAPPGERWLGLKSHFAEESPANTVDLYFFDGGYCGVQPVELGGGSSNNRVNACAMVRADVARSLPEVLSLHPALEERSQRWRPLMEAVSTSPLIFRNPHSLRENILLAGDAAAFVDPFIGDGISLALRSGAVAAQSLLPVFQKTASLAQACARYQAEYERDFARVYHASSQIRRMLRIPRGIRKPFVFLLEKTPGLSRYLVRKTR